MSDAAVRRHAWPILRLPDSDGASRLVRVSEHRDEIGDMVLPLRLRQGKDHLRRASAPWRGEVVRLRKGRFKQEPGETTEQ